jgi:formylglycine-generating enzyme required for sulfatase activity
LFNKLLKLKGRSDEQRQRDLLLIAELGEDVGWERLTAGDELFEALRAEVAEALVRVVEGTTLPAAERVQAGVYLGWLGDPRPGVCTLPPAMVRIAGGEFLIGILPEEQEAYFQAFKRDYPDGDNDKFRNFTRNWINDHPLTLPTFELARHPLTNAQWKLFIDEGGYNPDAPWWDEAGRAWLRRDDDATKGLEPWQKRQYKQHPEFWHSDQFGIARPNHPVVRISWYEAVAFCKWLTEHQKYNPDGYTYLLPSEAEWEYAARRATRRTYPWGDEEPDAERANFNRVYNGTSAVGCFAPGATPKDQIHDLAGNVWEWTRSVYRDYPYDPTDGREDTDTPTDKTFVLRGGGWLDRSYYLRASGRGYFRAPDFHYYHIGCRLARRLPRA